MKRLDGKTWEFFGCNENCFAVREPGTQELRVFEAIEDESDGYRSCLYDFNEVMPEDAKTRNLFFIDVPIATLVAREVRETHGEQNYLFDGLELFNEAGVWLRVGTDNMDDYYPSFTFDYQPGGGK